jgi:DNA-binding GntR family transcriptional regulator
MMSASSGGSSIVDGRNLAAQERLSTAVTVTALPVDSSVGSKAYHALRDAILRTDIYNSEVDLRLDEKQMAENLGVSRTPVREALARLEQEGLVEIVPRRGTYIARKDKAEIIEMITVWAALEGMAARLSAERASDEEISSLRGLFDSFPKGQDLHYRLDEYSAANLRFHQAVIDISHSPLIGRMSATLLVHVRAIRGRTIHDKDRVNNSIVDHMHIIEALEARDADRADRLVRNHALGLAEHVKRNVDYLQ